MNTELSAKATEIADYAQSLLTIGGYNSFSYADIADRVRITKATIHHHFPSKAELVRVVVARYREQARQGLATLDRQIADPLAQLNAYVDYWATCIRNGSSPFCICAMLAVELPTIPDEIAAEVRGHFQDLTDWLTSVLEKAAVTGQVQLQENSTIEARAFMAGVHGAMLAARGFGDPETFRTLVQLSIGRLTSAR
ncbi:TetR/AcrR family transcriptional regulator [Pseudomonas sp. MWU13-2105]|uniref:TetR/AcrR family transcriptional regulator n=1 Tax=Pseudomonas sp. MWU13-2105 TaxID=2935074 RepID=UPI00200EB5C2|nr:TetR/AcrR family transcriptional regulator [Pseudomonas sp. MWU13-2105]